MSASEAEKIIKNKLDDEAGLNYQPKIKLWHKIVAGILLAGCVLFIIFGVSSTYN